MDVLSSAVAWADPIVVPSITQKVDSSLFTLLSNNFAGLAGLAIALATVGIILTSLRMAASPTSEQTSSTLHTIRRILIVIVFLASLGSIIFWVCSDVVGVSPDGLFTIRRLFNLR